MPRGADLLQVRSGSGWISQEDFLDDEVWVEFNGSSFGPAAGTDLLYFSGSASPRGRGHVRGLWFSSRYRRLCNLSPEGKPGAARLNFVSATSVLGVLGAVVGAVLAVARRPGLSAPCLATV